MGQGRGTGMATGKHPLVAAMITLGLALAAVGVRPAVAAPEQYRIDPQHLTIDAAGIFTGHDGRDGHLRGGDVLDADHHPQIAFVGPSAGAVTQTTGQVIGDLTIRDVTRPVTLDVTWNKSGPHPFGNGYVIGVSARALLQRSEFGMTYAVDNGWVEDEVEVMIELEAIRQ